MSNETDSLTEGEAIAALERFIVDNDDLAELEAEVAQFNVFDALRMVNNEIRHSNFLAWLLDPSESHGQGAVFLRAVLMDLLRSAPVADRPMSPVDLDGVDMRGVVIRREWKNIDLLIAAEEPRFVVAIENKIGAGEHSNQLQRYGEIVGREFPDADSLFVFLTRDQEEPSDEAWCAYDYSSLYEAIDRVVRVHGDTIGAEVRVFLDQYLEMLRRRFMDDEKIDRLVERIYQNHRQALDIIIDRKPDGRGSLLEVFADRLKEDGEFWRYDTTGVKCRFMPAEWESIIPEGILKPYPSPHALLRGVFVVHQESCSLGIDVMRHSNQNTREHLINAIQQHGDGYGLGGSKKIPMGSWRVRKKQVIKFDPDDIDNEETQNKVKNLAGEMRDVMDRMTPLLRDTFR